MKVLSVVVTYYPEKETLLQNVGTFINYVDKLLIWENTPEEDSISYRYIEDSRVEYVSNGYNSISKGLNFAWRFAKNHGYDCLLTMDQDSVFEDFTRYMAQTESLLEKEECIVGPWYFPPVPHNDIEPVIEREHIITSGMIVPISVLDRLGGYCEDFKVDGIDIDLCVKACQQGIKVYQCVNERLVQKFGETYEKTVLWHRFSGPGYSPERLYEIMRNYLIIYRKYAHPEFVKKQLHWYIANYIPNVLFAERMKIRKLSGIVRGLWDGCRYKI